MGTADARNPDAGDVVAVGTGLWNINLVWRTERDRRDDGNDKRQRLAISGEVPSALDPPSGCRFHPRCPMAMARCATEAPLPKEAAPGHSVACHLY
jgi:oligopeptide/dipeptide ABC transporter ATP-binding protein